MVERVEDYEVLSKGANFAVMKQEEPWVWQLWKKSIDQHLTMLVGYGGRNYPVCYAYYAKN